MAQYYDEGGAIDTLDDDNSGAAPVVQQADDNSGAIPVDQQQSQGAGADTGSDTPGWNPQGSGPLAPAGRGVKRIISYLMGEGGVSPQELDQAGRQVDPRGQVDPGTRNLLAVDQANQAGGPEAAWKLVQGNRIAFNAKQAFGFAAMNGSGQKPPDLNAAIDAANQAEQHILDGSTVRFAPSQNGVTATVKVPGSSQTQQINLTPDQFKQYLNVGGDGQWDKLMENSVPATLQRISQSTSFGQGYDPASQAARPAAPQAPQARTNFGKTPSTINLSGNDNVQAPSNEDDGIDPDIRRKANTLFPAVSQGDERNRFMAAEMARTEELQNKLDVEDKRGTFKVQGADVKGQHDENKAKIYSAGREKAALANLQAHIQQQEASGIRNARTLQEKALATIVMTGGKMTPQQKAMWDQITAATPEPGKQQAPQSQPQQQAPAPKQQQLSAEDQQALAWANANASDPRAVKIKQKLGVQ